MFAALSLLASQLSPGIPCEPVGVAMGADPLPAAWQEALDALVRATTQVGQPWSCTGARLALAVDADANGAVLRVDDPTGRSVARHVPGPGDLVAMGEALLAVPVTSSPGTRDAATPPTTRPRDVGASSRTSTVDSPAPPLRHLLIDGVARAHYSAPTRILWGGAALHATIPFDAWSVGIRARFDLPAWIGAKVPAEFSVSEIGIGLALGRRLTTRPFELDATLSPSLAVVSMEAGDEADSAEGSRVDPRFALGLHAAWAWAPAWRALVAVDGEVAPMAFQGEAARRIDPTLPPLPAFLVGVSLGVGAIIR